VSTVDEIPEFPISRDPPEGGTVVDGGYSNEHTEIVSNF